MDKVIHFIAGIVIYMLACIWVEPLMGFIATVIVGAAKEWLWDVQKHGKPDFWDFMATVAGGLLLFIVQTL